MKSCSIARCERLHQLGAGAFAKVYCASRGGSLVAVKVFSPGGVGTGLDRARWESRAERLDHPGIAKVLGGGVVSAGAGWPEHVGAAYIVQSLATGTCATDVYGWPKMKSTLLRLLEALDHAHGRNLLHRDIKPGNVLVGGDGWRTRATLIDWGSCWDMTPRARNAFARYTVGTPRYMAPEQAIGDPDHFGPWTDLYALGVLAHRMATGYEPLLVRSTSEVYAALRQGDIPNRVDTAEWGKPFADWVGWLLDVSIHRRPQSAREALDALEAIEGLPEQ